ncbi:MAG TPA: serine/threonine-protein kinase [Vicinamibacterales bacterium]|jgi:serine/threonine protein kinase|nr:serine/threonine-protein kinase [Vicinamibacterales bacterium]
MTDVQAGEVLDERFEISELIGRGGMGSVFKATDLSTGRLLAVKIPFLELESDPAFYSRFQRELEIGKRLDHPGILKFLTVDRPSRPYLAMEYLDGETLWDRLHRIRPLPTEEALRIAALICEPLEYMHHNGIVHRDLKPTNIMLCRDCSLRIMDFGIAMMGATRRLTFLGFTERLGTPNYMAPEQIKGQRGDARTDIYSLGAILYEMTTGHAPYDDQGDLYSIMNARLVGDPVAPRAYNPTIPPEVEEIILHALARHPDHRYQTAAAMKAELLAPERIQVTGRADRLKVPSLVAHNWHVIRIMLLALMVPVLLFFVFWLMLKR